MTERIRRTLVELPCMILHRTWWIPIWNRSATLTCPISVACSKSPRFADWYFQLDPGTTQTLARKR